MKICLHPRIQMLSKSFHKGELSLADYRELRRAEFEQLNSASPKNDKRENACSSLPVKRVILVTLVSVALLFATVILARFLL